MRASLLLAGVCLFGSTSVMAQAGPVAEKSSDQIVCEMTGDCSGADSSLATQDKPQSRGFSIARPHAAASNAKASAPSAPRTRLVPNDVRRSVATAPGRSHVTVAPRTVGRSDLAINFVSGSAALTPSGRAQALAFLQAMRAPGMVGKRFIVGGHTDAVGSRALNLELSQRRAQSVIDFLVQNGASRSQFEARGYGFDKPAIPSNPRAAANRRVEFVKVD